MSEWERGEIAADARNENLINNGYVKSVMSKRSRWVSLLNWRMSGVTPTLPQPRPLPSSLSPSLAGERRTGEAEAAMEAVPSEKRKQKKAERKTSL